MFSVQTPETEQNCLLTILNYALHKIEISSNDDDLGRMAGLSDLFLKWDNLWTILAKYGWN